MVNHPCKPVKLFTVLAVTLSHGLDFVFRQMRLALLVDGCFRHGCLTFATRPRDYRRFLKKKLAGNKTRDRLANRALRLAGWKVIRIWEHELQRGKHSTFNAQHSISKAENIVQRILENLRANSGLASGILGLGMGTGIGV